MSMGYYARCHKILEDELTIIYEYACCNVGEGDWEKAQNTFDGRIYIDKDSFVEPTIREKLKKMPSGRKKLIVKRIHNEADYSKLIEEGKIEIENCSGTWKTYDGIDFMAMRLVRQIFDEYQDTGIISEHMILYS